MTARSRVVGEGEGVTGGGADGEGVTGGGVEGVRATGDAGVRGDEAEEEERKRASRTQVRANRRAIWEN